MREITQNKYYGVEKWISKGYTLKQALKKLKMSSVSYYKAKKYGVKTNATIATAPTTGSYKQDGIFFSYTQLKKLSSDNFIGLIKVYNDINATTY